MLNLKLKWILALSVTGTIFAAAVTVRQIVAPASEPGLFSCLGLSIFGLTPCPYGLALFLLLTILSSLILLGRFLLLPWLKLTAVVGVLFSGWVVWRELCLPAIQLGNYFWQTFSLARVPACAWGFLVFLIILILVLPLKRQQLAV